MVEKNLTANLSFIDKNKDSLLKEHNGKFLLVYEEKLIGSYDTYEKAAEEGVRLYGSNANFLVHHLLEKEPVNFIMEAML